MTNPLVNRPYVDRVTPINADWLNGVNDELQALNSTKAASSLGAGLIGWSQSGAGAVLRTVESKMRDTVSVADFGADPTGVADSTMAFTNAQTAGDCITVPPGTYLLTNFRHKNGKQFVCAGPKTILKQGDPAQPVWNMTSDATYGQLIDIGLLGRPTFQGAVASTCELLRMSAATPWAIQNAEVDIRALGGYNSLRMYVTAANEIYASRIKVTQTSSLNTGAILGGVYNQYWMHIAGAANGFSVQDNGWNSTFTQLVTEGLIQCNGSNVTAINPTVEAWIGTAQASAMQFLGPNPVIINANIVNVPAAKAPIGLAFNGAGSGTFTVLGFRVIGATDYPTYPLSIPAGNNGLIADAWAQNAGFKLDDYTADAVMEGITFAGDCSTISRRGFPKRVNLSVNRGDASVTLVPGVDAEVQRFNTALTANRTVTLSFTNAFNGSTFKIVRTGLGAFTLDFNGLKTLPAGTAAWAEARFDGSGWVLTGYGTL